MQNIFNFIKGLFEQPPQYPLGAIENPEDVRDIHISAVQAPIPVPPTYKTDISTLVVEHQGQHGTCVWQAISKLVETYQEKSGKMHDNLSARSGYILTKEIDGIPDIQGTYPRVGAKVLVDSGVATETVVPDDNTLPYQDYMSFTFTDAVKTAMKQNKLPGYAFIPNDLNAIKQAIFQNGVVVGSLPVDSNWFIGIIKRVTRPVGYHYTLWYGYDEEGIFARNSWGKEWGDGGNFYFKWEDYNDTARDIIAFLPIPKEVLDNVKGTNYKFLRTMKFGDRNNDIVELQKRLDKEGVWDVIVPKTGYYGSETAKAVLRYQIRQKIAPQVQLERDRGWYCGPLTIRELNGGRKKTLEEAIVQVESNGYLYAIGDKHLKDMAYGPMQIRQPACDDVNKRFGTNYRAPQMLGNLEKSLEVFRKYQEIYNPNGTDEEKARTWNGGPGWRRKPVLTDPYWEKVSTLLK